MTPNDFKCAEDLLDTQWPDAEDHERFYSRYGRSLFDMARSFVRLCQGVEALGVIGGGYCFCARSRDPDKAEHEPECRDLRAQLVDRSHAK